MPGSQFSFESATANSLLRSPGIASRCDCGGRTTWQSSRTYETGASAREYRKEQYARAIRPSTCPPQRQARFPKRRLVPYQGYQLITLNRPGHRLRSPPRFRRKSNRTCGGRLDHLPGCRTIPVPEDSVVNSPVLSGRSSSVTLADRSSPSYRPAISSGFKVTAGLVVRGDVQPKKNRGSEQQSSLIP